MAEIPHSVLSEHLQDRMEGRRLVAAVFLTFRFDPSFFEQEILPVFLDVPLSHAVPIKLVQLEDALRSVRGGVAVYYDQNGLLPEAAGGRLDVKRIPVRHRTGIFHPKNVFALVEDIEPDESGDHPKALLVACLSANLTRAGFWENVEVCHVEEVREGSATRIGEDLSSFLAGIERRVGERAADGHGALREIRKFLSKTEPRAQRSTGGVLHTHFFGGSSSFVEFLQKATDHALEGMNLEIISPYFDEDPESGPLVDLLKHVKPREVRVFLPRKDDGTALCSEALHAWIEAQSGVEWARLPGDLLRSGAGAEARRRMVHAKVYRFFRQLPKREILFIGSVNLTRPAHKNGGNLESGFLVEVPTPRRPEWWLEVEDTSPSRFAGGDEAEGTAASGGTKLSLRYFWNTGVADAYWDDQESPPPLTILHQGTTLFQFEQLPPREWVELSPAATEQIKRVLSSTSMLTVAGASPEPALLLVQEEGMYDRPSLLFELSPADILRYWSLLNAEQRAAFLDARAPESALGDEGAALVARVAPLAEQDTFFDRFAGIFHAFGCLTRSVGEALQNDNPKEATYRLFGRKYDSLGNLLERVAKEDSEGKGDPIEHYVISLCARQLLDDVRREHREYWDEHATDAREVHTALKVLDPIRDRIIARNPEDMPSFLEWFERWFVKRAQPVKEEAS